MKGNGIYASGPKRTAMAKVEQGKAQGRTSGTFPFSIQKLRNSLGQACHLKLGGGNAAREGGQPGVFFGERSIPGRRRSKCK